MLRIRKFKNMTVLLRCISHLLQLRQRRQVATLSRLITYLRSILMGMVLQRWTERGDRRKGSKNEGSKRFWPEASPAVLEEENFDHSLK